MKFSNRTGWKTEENALSLQLLPLKREGTPILDISVSNPTGCGFSYLSQEILKPLLASEGLAYEPDPHGLMNARMAVMAYYARKGIRILPEQVFLTASTSEAYSFVLRLLADPGDIVMAPKPGYPLLEYLAPLNDIRLERYPLFYSNTWKMDFEILRSDPELLPKAILVVNPSNPTGNYLGPDEISELNMVAMAKQAALISDEVFLDYPLETPLTEISSLASNKQVLTFTISGISKILGLPQMKLSWIVVNGPTGLWQEAVKRLEVISDTYLSASTPVQLALGPWFELEKKIHDEIGARIRKNYELLKSSMTGLGACRVLKTGGGWYAVIQIPSKHTDEEWAVLLLKKDQVLTHPGYFFDFGEETVLVVCLLAEEAVFAEAARRMAERLRQEL